MNSNIQVSAIKNERYSGFVQNRVAWFKKMDKQKGASFPEREEQDSDAKSLELLSSNHTSSEENNLYFRIAENLNSPIIFYDNNLNLSYVNYKAAKVLLGQEEPGFDESHKTGIRSSFFNWMRKELYRFASCDNNEKEIRKTIQTIIGWLDYEIKFTRMKDVNEKDIGIIVEFKDISKIKKQMNHLSGLKQIDNAIIGGFELHQTLSLINEQVCEVLGFDAVAVFLPTLDPEIFECASFHGFKTDVMRSSKVRFHKGYFMMRRLEQRQDFRPNLLKYQYPFGNIENLDAEEFTYYIPYPLFNKGKIMGVLGIFNRQNLNVDQEWWILLEDISTQIAIGIENCQLRDEINETNRNLLNAYDTTLKGWAKALEFRDYETKGHADRVVQLTLDMASEMNYPENKMIYLQRGALLHDIGKLGIPDDILKKPGSLTDREWEIMRQHPIMAYDWLSSISFLEDSLDIPYCHHERWDGTGYPQGLKGEQIPLSARIFAIIDVYDALRSDRPYRKAWSRKTTIQHIRDQSGKHFDPEVVEKFVEMLKDHPII